MRAGAGQVIASRWPVADRSTADFMGHLYRSWRSQPLGRALQQARLAMLRGDYGAELRHPYYWAPFALVSGGRRGA